MVELVLNRCPYILRRRFIYFSFCLIKFLEFYHVYRYTGEDRTIYIFLKQINSMHFLLLNLLVIILIPICLSHSNITGEYKFDFIFVSNNCLNRIMRKMFTLLECIRSELWTLFKIELHNEYILRCTTNVY